MNLPRPFSPSRLIWGRRRRGLSQVELATAIGVDVRSIKAYEGRAFVPQPERLRTIARRLEFPLHFFLADRSADFIPSRVSFRSPPTPPAAQRNIALGSAAVAIVLDNWIAARYALPSLDLPETANVADPAAAAERLRRAWGLDDRPIDDMAGLLESKGVRVYAMPGDASAARAFSLWHGDLPYVFLNLCKATDQIRIDAAHELGHFVLRRGGEPGSRKAQQEAAAFARAFLMPRSGFPAEATGARAADWVLATSLHWGVPPATLGRRLRELGGLSDWQYRKIQECLAAISEQGENEPAPRPAPKILQSVFAALRSRGVTKHTLARELHVYLKDVDELVFGQASAQLADDSAASRAFHRLRPRLAVASSER